VDSLQTLVQHRLLRADASAQAVLDDAGAPPAEPGSTTPHHRRLHPRPPIAGGHPRDARDGALLHGRYRLLERLGAGGFGVVWRAQDELLHRGVALKRIPLPPEVPPPSGREEHEPELQTCERASREALASARLAHPAIVALYEAYVDEDAFYLVSELVHGDTLAALIATEGLADEELLRIGVALTQALIHAHARGVIHRDVKPQNVLVPYDHGPREAPAKLTDFGGASLAGEDALTRTGETLGTLAYMAPEQSEGREVGESADLYSLALVLYEGLTGSNPVRGLTPAATARRIGHPLPTLAVSRPDLTPILVHALDTALAIDPDCRGTLDQLRGALEQTLADDPTRRRGSFGPRIIRRRPSGAHARPARAADRPSSALSTHLAWPDLARHDIDGENPALARPSGISRSDMPGNRPKAPTRQSTIRAPSSLVAAQARPYSFPLPRALLAGCVLAAAVWLLMSARPGVALLLLVAATPLLLLGPRPGIGWTAAAFAPLLGLAGLAGAYPALAGQPSRWSARATLGALGYWWLILAGPLLADGSSGGRLWLAAPAGLPPRVVWEGSLERSAIHVIGPALSPGVLFGAILWAAGAAALPWVVRGRSAIFDTLAAVLWSVALLAAAPYFDAGLSTASVAQPRGALVGAILGAAIVIAARALRGPVSARHP
jgi:eukaryotic-like serine/threonine-protein kinase